MRNRIVWLCSRGNDLDRVSVLSKKPNDDKNNKTISATTRPCGHLLTPEIIFQCLSWLCFTIINFKLDKKNFIWNAAKNFDFVLFCLKCQTDFFRENVIKRNKNKTFTKKSLFPVWFPCLERDANSRMKPLRLEKNWKSLDHKQWCSCNF